MVIPGIEKLSIRTRFLPPVEYDFTDPEPSKAVQALKPQVSMQIAGRQHTLYQPYGPPGESFFPWIAGGMAAMLLAVGYVVGSR